MKAKHFLMIINHATIGHKLQGSGVDALFVHEWKYVTNWVYIILSRVRTLSGLYCRVKLKKDLTLYRVQDGLQRMMLSFEKLKPQYWTDEEYDMFFDD